MDDKLRQQLYKIAQENHWHMAARETEWAVYDNWLDADLDERIGTGATPDDALLDAAQGRGLVEPPACEHEWIKDEWLNPCNEVMVDYHCDKCGLIK